MDGTEQEVAEGASGFTLNNVQENHAVKVTFTKIPFPIFKAILIGVGTLMAVAAVLLIFRHIELNLKRKRRREMLARRRERNRRREKMLEKELDQLEELEDIIDKFC